MGELVKSWLATLGKIILSEVLKPLEEIKETQRQQGEQISALSGKMEKLHKVDPIAEECDLAILDDRICSQIAHCREKGYTTAEDRRRVNRMHEAYKARGGNHGEEREFELFCHLPTEEEFKRMMEGMIHG